MTIVAVVPDLMDRSRLGPLGEVRHVRTPGDALEASEPGDVVLLDLTRPGATAAVPTLVAGGRRVLAFTNHTDETTLDAARSAGAESMPRSAFFRRVETGTLLGGGHDG